MSTNQILDELVSYFENELERELSDKEIEFLHWVQEKIKDSR